MQPVVSQHIEIRPSAIHGQKACIAGTRISVQDIYVWHELVGMTPDQIVSEHPFLSLTQVHAALAYYFEHTDEIRRQVKAGADEAERIKAANPPRLSAKIADINANGDSVSS
ncbi:MAG: DUF433 domain-containing protein [Pirellulales bacterium]